VRPAFLKVPSGSDQPLSFAGLVLVVKYRP